MPVTAILKTTSPHGGFASETWNRLFFGNPEINWQPNADVYEDEKGLTLQFDVPGVTAQDLDIRLEKGTLTVKGERKLQSSTNNYFRVERAFGTFQRTFTLPEFVASDAIEAKLTDGVLTVFVPRSEAAKPKQIQVQVKAA